MLENLSKINIGKINSSIAIIENDDVVYLNQVEVSGFEPIVSNEQSLGLFVENALFKEEVQFMGSCNRGFRFRYCVFEGCVLINNTSFNNNFLFENCEFKSSVVISGGSFNDLRIYGRILGSLDIWRGSFESLLIGNEFDAPFETLNEINVNFDNLMGNIYFKSLWVDSIKFGGLINKDTNVMLEGINMRGLHFNNLINEGRLRLFSNNNSIRHVIRFEPEPLNIVSSNLGKTEFYNFTFKTFHPINISESYLIDCLFINVIWPLDFFTSNYWKSKYVNFIESKDLFKQLKYSHYKQGDVVKEHEFHAMEMYAQMRLSGYKLAYDEDVNHKIRFKSVKYLFSQHFLNWTVLALSRWSSNFGLSWTRPLVFALLVNIVFFNWMVASGIIPGIGFNFSIKGIERSFSIIPVYFYYINPLRKFEYIKITWGIIPDILMRTISSYCIYNFIRATRRFVK